MDLPKVLVFYMEGGSIVTPERRRELDMKAMHFCMTHALPTSKALQLGKLLVEVEREVWERAAEVILDLLREHVPGSPGISVLMVAANRCKWKAEEAQ